ncbi:MAG: conserved hypothetical protein [Methanobrevibacter sp. CfCl-M3]
MFKKMFSLMLIAILAVSMIGGVSAWTVDSPLHVRYSSAATSHLFTMDITDPDTGDLIVHDVVDVNILNEEKEYSNIPDKLLKVKVNSRAWKMAGFLSNFRWEDVGTTKEDTFQISKTNCLQFKTDVDTIWNGGHLKISKYNI